MAVNVRRQPARSHLPQLLVGLSLIAAVVAVLPIVVSMFGGRATPGLIRTAFASAPSGEYVVVSRTEDTQDVIGVVSASGGTAFEVARVPHLPGFASTGAVSPEGRRVALVVADGGSLTRPLASLLVADLETGAIQRVASPVDVSQTPVWAPDGQSIVILWSGEESAGTQQFQFFRVAADGSSLASVASYTRVIGAYAVGFEPSGAFLSVVVDGRGSVLMRDGAEVAGISPNVTRDWRLSPDGQQLAFVEAQLDGGLRYVARQIALSAGAGRTIEALSAANAGQQMGAAWKPGAGAATFGQDPAGRTTEVGRESLTATGFDVPLAYSGAGGTLAVTHWSGSSFANPGNARIDLVSNGARVPVTGYGRFLGWATR